MKLSEILVTIMTKEIEKRPEVFFSIENVDLQSLQVNQGNLYFLVEHALRTIPAEIVEKPR